MSSLEPKEFTILIVISRKYNPKDYPEQIKFSKVYFLNCCYRKIKHETHSIAIVDAFLRVGRDHSNLLLF